MTFPIVRICLITRKGRRPCHFVEFRNDVFVALTGLRPVAEIDIVALARVTNGVKSAARGAYVANVTMLAVGRDFHLCIIVATLTLTFVVRFPTGQAVRLFRIVVFEVVSESFFDVSIQLCRIIAPLALAGVITSPIPVLGAGWVAGFVLLQIVPESGHPIVVGVVIATLVGTLCILLGAPPLASRLNARNGYR